MEFVGISKLSLLDYPGKMAAILFTKGCNFRCPFCHNGLTLLEENTDELIFDDIISFLKKRVGILDGVVISGGEPTLMPDLKNKIIKIRELGYKIKLDTNGTNPDVVRDLVNSGLVDYIAMDIKNSEDKYESTTNAKVNINKIKETIKFLSESNIDYEFRTTLVAEYHDEASIKQMGELIKGAPKLFLQQFKISDGVINKNLHPVDEDLANKFKDILSNYVSKVELRGY